MPFLERILSVFAPHNCLVCESEGKLVCGWCAQDAFQDIPSRCYRCKRLTSDSAVCLSCRRRTPLKHVWIRTEYGETAKELLRLYKYERARSADAIIAEAMNEVLPYFQPNTLIIPVPTATSRMRKRGYDHAALLARNLACSHSLLCSRAVTHLTQSRQVGASREQRLRQLKTSLMVIKPEMVKNSEILLVDDVVTTGATLETMAAILKEAGAKTINAVVFAQKQ